MSKNNTLSGLSDFRRIVKTTKYTCPFASYHFMLMQKGGRMLQLNTGSAPCENISKKNIFFNFILQGAKQAFGCEP